MPLKASSILLIAMIAGMGSACNYVHPKGQDDSEAVFGAPLDQSEIASTMNYPYISENILKPKCIGCHGTSGGVNLESYANVIGQLHAIHQSVFVKKTMPKRGSLSNEEKRLLSHWLKMGAPHDSPIAGAPTPPPPEELKPTYNSINRNIFQVKCVSCHAPGEVAERVLLDRQSLLDSPLQLVIPGNADESGLVISVERTDQNKMPPALSGYAPLTANEKEAIRTWITNGAL